MQVGLFVTCLVDLMRPSVGFAALQLLEDAGCSVVVPEHQTCCGQPNWNAGDRPAAQALARKMMAEFRDCAWVVVPSGSCAAMLRNYPELFPEDPLARAEAVRLAQRTHELTDFLVTIAGVVRVRGAFAGSVTYHDSCSGLRELGVKAQPRRLLAMVPSLRLEDMKECETCCGFGGSFAIKYGEISAQMAERKCEHIAECGGDAVVLGDLGCMLHIEGRLRRRGDMTTKVLHVAEVLAGQLDDSEHGGSVDDGSVDGSRR